MRIYRGVKSIFVLDALETADIASIRPSFIAKETELEPETGEARERGALSCYTPCWSHYR